MESNKSAVPTEESVDAKPEFRKPLGEAGNRRKYRRRSPANGSSSSEDNASRDRSSSPVSRRESAKISETRHRKDDRRDLSRDSGRSLHGRSDESYKISDRHSSRSSRSYHRHDDYDGRDKYAEDNERDYSKLSSHSGRDLKRSTYSDHSKRRNEPRSTESPRESEKYYRDKSDNSGHRSRDKERETLYGEYKKYRDKDLSSDKAVSGGRHTSSIIDDVRSGDKHKEDRDARDYRTDSRRGLGDYRSTLSPTHEGSRGYQNDSTSRRDRSGRHLRETSRGYTKDTDNDRKEGKKKYDDQDRYKQRYYEDSREKLEDRKSSPSKGQDSPAKKPKLFRMDATNGDQIDDEKQPSSSKQAQESDGKATSERAYVTDSDIDAAKVAAMKAAELVNRNLVGTGYMSTEQKKKLLWGNKKSTTAEQSAHHWDIGDRERQGKFNKLMGVKGDLKVEQKPEMDDAEQQKIQLDLEKQYTAGLRRRDGRTVGLGL